MPHIVTLQRVGNSLSLTVPSILVHELDLQRGRQLLVEAPSKQSLRYTLLNPQTLRRVQRKMRKLRA